MVSESGVETDLLMETTRVRFDLVSAREVPRIVGEVGAERRLIVIEVGCGVDPICAISKDEAQKRAVIWIGIDPGIRGLLLTSSLGDGVDMKILVRDEASSLVGVVADLIVMVAPNPRDLVDDLLEQVEGFFVPNKTKIVIALDDRTHESKEFRRDAILAVQNWAVDQKVRVKVDSVGPVLEKSLDSLGLLIDAGMSQDAGEMITWILIG